MADSGTIMAFIGAFIGVAIMLGVGIQILGNATFGDCSNIKFINGSNNTGWQLACNNAATSTQNAYNLLIVILIVVAAVAILFVVRML